MLAYLPPALVTSLSGRFIHQRWAYYPLILYGLEEGKVYCGTVDLQFPTMALTRITTPEWDWLVLDTTLQLWRFPHPNGFRLQPGNWLPESRVQLTQLHAEGLFKLP